MSEPATQIAIAVVERDGYFLVGERPAGKPLAGDAEFPGGRVEAGETPEVAAVRECMEETGLSIAIVGSYDDRLHEYAHDRLHLHFFACRIVGAVEEPRKPFRWVSRRDLRMLKFPEANRSLVRLLRAENDSSYPLTE
ncbi:MAG: NUDIX domain-containing protein [Planctomycetes bacterium]|nr:NUDIX domain-containing protein [Planctomycetota bacterium]